MKVVIKRVGEMLEVREVENELEVFKEIVGGYIECISIANIFVSEFRNVICVCNEEGKLMGLPGNFFFGLDMICGDAFFCAVNGEDFDSLNDAQINRLMEVFNN